MVEVYIKRQSITSRRWITVLTMDHVLDSLCIIFRQVDDSSLRLSKGVADGSIEEFASWADDGAVHRVSFHATNNG